jgi:FMN-dependent NADH-azoreductase
MEHQESYLKVIFGFFGITDVRIVRAEGLGLGDAVKAAALAAARADIAQAVGRAANQDQATLAA